MKIFTKAPNENWIIDRYKSEFDYYNSSITIDGNAVTPKYTGGTAFTAGNANSIDAYSYTIIKTASATFTVLVSQTKFA